MDTEQMGHFGKVMLYWVRRVRVHISNNTFTSCQEAKSLSSSSVQTWRFTVQQLSSFYVFEDKKRAQGEMEERKWVWCWLRKKKQIGGGNHVNLSCLSLLDYNTHVTTTESGLLNHTNCKMSYLDVGEKKELHKVKFHTCHRKTNFTEH